MFCLTYIHLILCKYMLSLLHANFHAINVCNMILFYEIRKKNHLRKQKNLHTKIIPSNMNISTSKIRRFGSPFIILYTNNNSCALN